MYFLALQSTYHSVELGIFQNTSLCDQAIIPKLEASKFLVPRMADLLKKYKLTLADCSFLVGNQGPAPFTTLRVVLATLNGTSFASQIPLIGIDALDAMQQEFADPHYETTVVLLNAFNKEIYFSISHKDLPITTGYMGITIFLHELAERNLKDVIRFIGNGVELYREAILEQFKEQAFIPLPNPEYCSLGYTGKLGLDQWQAGIFTTHQLRALHLKRHAAE